MNINDILEIDGIVVRKVPTKEKTYWRTSRAKVIDHKENGGETFIDKNGREIIVRNNTNPYSGKYFITFANNTDSQVYFNKQVSGIGNTIEEAYEDYLNKKFENRGKKNVS